jgi:hypothetical protein
MCQFYPTPDWGNPLVIDRAGLSNQPNHPVFLL